MPSNNLQSISLRSLLQCLIVDDSLVSRKLLKRAFEKAGCLVDLAENGVVAVNKMKTSIYDVVFMDLDMPIMDGLEATRRIRKWEDLRRPGKRSLRVVKDEPHNATDTISYATSLHSDRRGSAAHLRSHGRGPHGGGEEEARGAEGGRARHFREQAGSDA